MLIIMFFCDVLIYSSSEEDHSSHHKIILQNLKDKELYSKFSECEFLLMFIAFFKHILFGDMI